MSNEWVTGPEEAESSGRVITFSLWRVVFWDGISFTPSGSYTTVTRQSLQRLWEQGKPREDEDDFSVAEAMLLRVTITCTHSLFYD